MNKRKNSMDSISRDYLIKTLCHCVKIPSCSSDYGGNEGALQKFVADEMVAIGARVKKIEVSDVDGFCENKLCYGPDRQYENRPTVVGELGPIEAPALLVLAHSDTVGVERREEWSFDPFCGSVQNGNILGLGSGDDKWGIACMLTIMKNLKARAECFHRRVIFASTIDEENGVCNGLLLLMLAGIKAEAALYLDGCRQEINMGNLGGSVLFIYPRNNISVNYDAHFAQLKEACKIKSKERKYLFNRDYFVNNAVRDNSINVIERTDRKGKYLMVRIYTLPGEEKNKIATEIKDLVDCVLGKSTKEYEMKFKEPWFESALVSDDNFLFEYLKSSMLRFHGKEGIISTVAKQDAFVLQNYARIPTISFGISRSEFDNPGGKGGQHQPDEAVRIEDVWSGFKVAYDTVSKWGFNL